MNRTNLFAGTPRDPARIDEILTEIGKIWKKYPDSRFYQLLSWFETDYAKKDKFYVEDRDFQEGIEKFKGLRGIK